MPRNPTEPNPPISPAGWLANFRYFRAGEDGAHLSSEALGFRLGVSGATVRRWESGQAQPNESDLFRFADVCHLSPLQREFVLRLFAGTTTRGEAGVPINFHAEVTSVLSIQRPAYVVDELFYIRAWNSHFAAVTGGFVDLFPDVVNAVELGLTIGALDDPDEEAERVRTITRLTWMWTAHLAGFPAYAELVTRLLDTPAFADNWQAIAREPVESVQRPLIMPIVQRRPPLNLFTVYTGQILFPPLYHLFVYEPRDSQTAAYLASRVGNAAPKVSFANRTHWAD